MKLTVQALAWRTLVADRSFFLAQPASRNRRQGAANLPRQLARELFSADLCLPSEPGRIVNVHSTPMLFVSLVEAKSPARRAGLLGKYGLRVRQWRN